MSDRRSASLLESLPGALATLEVLARGAGVTLDRARSRRVLANLSAESGHGGTTPPAASSPMASSSPSPSSPSGAARSHRAALLPLVAEQLGVRINSAYLTLDEALAAARGGMCLAAPAVASSGARESAESAEPLESDDDLTADRAETVRAAVGGEQRREPPSIWIVIQRVEKQRAEVWSFGVGARWIEASDLLRLVGAIHSEQPIEWFSVQHATLSQASPPGDVAIEHGPSRSGMGGHGHDHGHGHGGHGTHDAHHHLSPLARLRQLLRPDRGDIAMIGLFSLVVGLLGLATPIAVESLVNAVSFGRLVQPLVVICLMLLALLSFAATIKVLQAYVAELIQRRLFVRVVADLSYRLPRTLQSELDREHPPELINRFFDVMTLQKSAALLVLDGLTMLLTTLIGMAVLAVYHPLLLGFDVFLVAAFAFAVFALGRGAVRTAIDESKAKYAVAAWLEEMARTPTTMKGADGPRHALEHADILASSYVNRRQAHFRILLRQIIFTVAMQALAGSLVLGLGGWLVLNGQLSLGQLVAAEMIVAVVVGSFAKLGKQMESFYDLLAAADKVGHLLDLPMERSTGELLPDGDGVTIVARKLMVAVEDSASAHAVNDEFEFHVGAGEMVALVGRPGGGKSLMLDVFYGLREPSSGHATLDGVDVRALQPTELRRHVTLLREVELLSGAIGENVHLHRDGVGGVAVRRALRQVGLLDELMSLRGGLETTVQPHGRPLSSSQTVRLMFARAVASPPRLLLIDGLLDRLSDDTLPVVIRAVRSLLPRTTVVVVTGRDDVRQFCDRVVSVDSNPTTPDDQLKDWEPIDGRGLARDTA